jgi:hypothetical protein
MANHKEKAFNLFPIAKEAFWEEKKDGISFFSHFSWKYLIDDVLGNNFYVPHTFVKIDYESITRFLPNAVKFIFRNVLISFCEFLENFRFDSSRLMKQKSKERKRINKWQPLESSQCNSIESLNLSFISIKMISYTHLSALNDSCNLYDSYFD